MLNQKNLEKLFDNNYQLLLSLFEDAEAIISCYMLAGDITSFARIEAEEAFPKMAERRMKHMLYLNSRAREEGYQFIDSFLRVSKANALDLSFQVYDAVHEIVVARLNASATADAE